jgi:hypothetical protein
MEELETGGKRFSLTYKPFRAGIRPGPKAVLDAGKRALNRYGPSTEKAMHSKSPFTRRL